MDFCAARDYLRQPYEDNGLQGRATSLPTLFISCGNIQQTQRFHRAARELFTAMLPHPSFGKADICNGLTRSAKVLLKRISSPIRREFPFFVLFFLLISLSTLKFFISGMLGFHLDPIVFEDLARGLSVSYVFTAIISYTRKKWLKVMFYAIGLSLFGLNVFLWLVFHLIIQPQIITFIGETNSREATEFLSTYLFSRNGIISIIVICFALMTVVMAELRHELIDNSISQKTSWTARKAFLWGTVITVLFGFGQFDIFYHIAKSKTTDDLPIKDTFPYDTVTKMIFSLNSIRTTRNELQEAVKASCKAEKGTIAANDSLNVVYIIGESYIKYHSNLYGYPLLTTPRLTKEKAKGNLYIFNDVVSAYAATSLTIRNTFCCNSLMDNEKWYHTPFFPVIFKRTGFDVYYWDNQKTDVTEGLTGFTTNSFLYNKTIASLSYTASSDKTFRYDDQLIQDYFKNKKPTGKYNLIMFHLWGQHIDAASRYPHNKSFNRFTFKDIRRRDSYLTESKLQDIANYDNATYYNDSVISHIINRYLKTNAVIVYLSDHGEEIYDYRDSKGRVSAAPGQYKELLKYQYGIPFMIWCSDTYKRKHPQVIRNIKAALDKPFMTDNVCQILFDLSGIQTKYYVPQRDLLSPKYKIRDRILGNGDNYDKIMRSHQNK
ncbi:phosphoethanolamine transferase [Prevotella multiformis]|uniref:phosphoethanolamine transferase n=1 Tax=Prevotella multiformis TaxID=282402 RepID=UPI003FA0A2D6